MVVNRHGPGRRERDDRAADGELRDQTAAEQRADASAAARPRRNSRPRPAEDGGRGGGPPARGEACAAACRGARPEAAGARVSDARGGGGGRVRRPVSEDRHREPGAGRDRQHGRERLALAGERELEVAAARAQPQVPAQGPAAQLAAARDGELFANLQAGGVVSVAVGEQRAARLKDQRLDLAHLAPHDRRDRLVGEVVELGQQQRRALVLGQAADAGDELAQVLAPVRPPPTVPQRGRSDPPAARSAVARRSPTGSSCARSRTATGAARAARSRRAGPGGL